MGAACGARDKYEVCVRRAGLSTPTSISTESIWLRTETGRRSTSRSGRIARKAPRNWAHVDGDHDHDGDDDRDEDDDHAGDDKRRWRPLHYDHEEQNDNDGDQESDAKYVFDIDVDNVINIHHGVHDEVYHWVPHYRWLGKLEWQYCGGQRDALQKISQSFFEKSSSGRGTFDKYLSVHLAVAEDGGHGDGGVGRPTEAEHPHHHDHLGCQSLVIASAEVLAKFTNVSCSNDV